MSDPAVRQSAQSQTNGDPLCPVCGNAEPIVYLEGVDEEIQVEMVGSSRTKLSHGRILRCVVCGLGYRAFRPPPETLATLYRTAKDDAYEAELVNRRRTAERHKRIVLQYCQTPGTVIDVGCASGAFLSVMSEAGWRVIGIEPSGSQYERARNLLHNRVAIWNCVLQDAALPEKADLVTMWDVLEHVVDPVGFLAVGASHLRPGGYLLLNVPRFDSLIAKALGGRWPVLLAEHFSYFTVDSLQRCGAQSGLEVIAIGQRPVTFTLDYLLHRAAQHAIPGARFVHNVVKKVRVEKLAVALPVGEMYSVLRKV